METLTDTFQFSQTLEWAILFRFTADIFRAGAPASSLRTLCEGCTIMVESLALTVQHTVIDLIYDLLGRTQC